MQKRGRSAANWIKELPVGEYSMNELLNLTCKDRKTISSTLKKYGAETIEKTFGKSKSASPFMPTPMRGGKGGRR